ncbi:hypothetical protein [Streptomyces sp. NPDC007355]|uniref:hypothetical protein n=1 Tax=unclassified Streptomyces TaxID=2593676 RepID=UPI003676D95C
MPVDPFAVLQALLRAEASRSPRTDASGSPRADRRPPEPAAPAAAPAPAPEPPAQEDRVR